MRALLALLAFLALLTIAVASASSSLDATIVILIWAAFLVGGLIVVVKNIRSGRADIYGQLGALPRRWQRWILDEREKRPRDRPRSPEN